MGEPTEKCLLFLKLCPKFQWIIDAYFPRTFMRLYMDAEAGNEKELMEALNNMWFHLPDRKFNIIENPPGWAEFLQVIEY